MKNTLTKKSENFPLKKIDWTKIQIDMKQKLGNDIRNTISYYDFTYSKWNF